MPPDATASVHAPGRVEQTALHARPRVPDAVCARPGRGAGDLDQSITAPDRPQPQGPPPAANPHGSSAPTEVSADAGPSIEHAHPAPHPADKEPAIRIAQRPRDHGPCTHWKRR